MPIRHLKAFTFLNINQASNLLFIFLVIFYYFFRV